MTGSLPMIVLTRSNQANRFLMAALDLQPLPYHIFYLDEDSKIPEASVVLFRPGPSIEQKDRLEAALRLENKLRERGLHILNQVSNIWTAMYRHLYFGILRRASISVPDYIQNPTSIGKPVVLRTCVPGQDGDDIYLVETTEQLRSLLKPGGTSVAMEFINTYHDGLHWKHRIHVMGGKIDMAAYSGSKSWVNRGGGEDISKGIDPSKLYPNLANAAVRVGEALGIDYYSVDAVTPVEAPDKFYITDVNTAATDMAPNAEDEKRFTPEEIVVRRKHGERYMKWLYNSTSSSPG